MLIRMWSEGSSPIGFSWRMFMFCISYCFAVDVEAVYLMMGREEVMVIVEGMEFGREGGRGYGSV